MIQVNNLRKMYYEGEIAITEALRGVSFEIKKGEFVSIMGPSGSGKSTLLHILSLMERSTEGFYSFFGKNVNNFKDSEFAHIRNEQMGFVFQAFNLLGRLSVYANVEMPLLYSRKISPSDRRKKVESAISQVDLEDKLGIEAGKLSGGQKQRVAIARALVLNPDIIFADEPTGNLDSNSGANIMDILQKLNKLGKTIILVTHETYTAAFAKRCIRIRDGLVESDTRNNGEMPQNYFK